MQTTSTTPNAPTTIDEDALLEDALLVEVTEYITSDLPDLPDPLHDEDY